MNTPEHTRGVNATTESVLVLLESECPEQERATIAEAFAEARIPAEVRCDIIRRSAGLAPWVIDLQVGVEFLMAAAGTGFGLAAGTAVWQGLQQLVQRLYKAREGSDAPQGGVILRDPVARLEIQLPPDLGDEA